MGQRASAVVRGGDRGRRAVTASSLLALGFVGGLLAGTPGSVVANSGPDPYARLTPLGKVLSYIERSYVDPVDQGALIDAAIKGAVGALDPHSEWFSPQEVAAMREESERDFVGVGLELEARGGRLVVITPVEGSPAEGAGVRQGDALVGIDGVSVAGWTARQAIDRLRGPEGSAIQLEVLRGAGEGQRLTFDLKRAVIQIDAVSVRSLSSGMGYVRIRSFQEGVAREVKAGLEELAASPGGLRGLVVDLRGNPGGYFLEAVQVADLFLDEGLIVTTRGREDRQTQRFEARAETTVFGGPLAVLIDGGSASSSEILAGALKDQGRAALVGVRTFGKGTVQTIVDLKDGSSLKLTTARYCTPSGASIQDRGVAPDVEVAQEGPLSQPGSEGWLEGDAALRMGVAHLRSVSKVGERER